MINMGEFIVPIEGSGASLNCSSSLLQVLLLNVVVLLMLLPVPLVLVGDPDPSEKTQ